MSPRLQSLVLKEPQPHKERKKKRLTFSTLELT